MMLVDQHRRAADRGPLFDDPRELEDKMAVLLGGRAAEQLVFDEISTGAADDLARVTDIARAMVLRYGMSEALGSVAYDRERSPFLQSNFPLPQERSDSEDTAHSVDGAVRTPVDAALQRALAILERNHALLDQTAGALLKTETLNEAEIARLKQKIITDRDGSAAPKAESRTNDECPKIAVTEPQS